LFLSFRSGILEIVQDLLRPRGPEPGGTGFDDLQSGGLNEVSSSGFSQLIGEDRPLPKESKSTLKEWILAS
jgi:hypothetical protein